jgi:tetratricopeptide (TPR) repeat protein
VSTSSGGPDDSARAARVERRSPTRPVFKTGWRKALARAFTSEESPAAATDDVARVDVWLANPAALISARSCLTVLSPDDWAAINRVRDPNARRSAIASRVLLRIGLSKAVEHKVPPTEWRFTEEARVGALLSALLLAACQTTGENSPTAQANGDPLNASAMAEPEDTKFIPSNQPLKTGLEHFNRGDYGLAERHLRDAVEKNPRDAPAWIMLAASYDRLSRFDLADRAYGIAQGLTGETIELLNNQGYSLMLRGNFKAARKKLMQAYKRDPNNATVLNNLKLLETTARMREG